MSLKKISKKVLAEYQAVKGDRESYEELISKFNKKINKTVGVRVLKDKAKLLPEDQSFALGFVLQAKSFF